MEAMSIFTILFLVALVVFGPPALRAFVLVSAACILVVGLFGVALAAMA